MIPIVLSDIAVSKEPITKITGLEAWNSYTRCKIESCSNPYQEIIPCKFHSMVEATHTAYSKHYPLVISPDMIWLMVAQGVAAHVNANAEELRDSFVDFKGRKYIEIRRDSFSKGSKDNDWEGTFEEFSLEVKRLMKPGIHEKLVASFSTTGIIEKAANEIVLLETVKSFFDYGMRTKCYIPVIVQEGTPEDWSLMVNKVQGLEDIPGISKWLNVLMPVISKMASSASGKDEKSFWKEWYKLKGGSGGPYISGHISKFFPYTYNYETDSCTRKIDFEGYSNLTTDDLPNGLSAAPLRWIYYDTDYKMSLKSGFLGCTQNKEDFSITPRIGWAVIEEGLGIDKKFMRVCKKCGDEKLIDEFSISNRRDKKEPGSICNDCFYSM